MHQPRSYPQWRPRPSQTCFRAWVGACWLWFFALGCGREAPPSKVDEAPRDPAAIHRDFQAAKEQFERAEACYRDQEVDSAIKYLRKADQLLSGVPTDTAGLIPSRVSYYKGYIAQVRSELPTAFQEYSRSLERAMLVQPSDSLRTIQLFKAHNALANLCSQLGMLDNAMVHAETAVTLISGFSKPDPLLQTIGLTTLGVISQGSGDTTSALVHHFRRADECFQKVLEIRLRTPGIAPNRIGNAFLNLGDLHRLWGHEEIATRNLNAAWEIYAQDRQNGAPGMTACASTLAQAARDRGDWEEALHWFEEAYKASDVGYGPHHRERGKIFIEEGRLWLDRGEGRRALACFHRALSEFIPAFDGRPSHQNPEVWELGREWYVTTAIAGKAEAYAMIRPDSSADSAFGSYIDAVRYGDHLRQTFGTLEERSFLAKSLVPVTEEALNLLQESYRSQRDPRYLELAFEIMERTKANELLDAINQVEASGEYSIPDETVTRGREIADNLDKCRQGIRDGNHALLPELLKLEDDSVALQQQVRSQYPGFFFADTKYHSWEETKKAVGACDTMVIEYSLAQDNLYVLAGCGNRDTTFAFAWTDSLQSAIAALQVALLGQGADPLYPGFTDPAYFLYSKLLLPAFGISPRKGYPPSRLIIVPDGQLAFIPFEALLTEPIHQKERARALPYLLKTTTVSYTPSIQILLELRQRAAIGNENGMLGMGTNLEMGDKEVKFPALQYAAGEAEYAVEQMGGKVILNADATEKTFKNEVSQYGLIHLSTHGMLNPAAPLRSCVMFHQDADSLDDGFLYAYEIYQQQLNASLTVLSACSAGKGKWMPGLGVMSVGRSFMVAGCSNVVMTLQDVDDQKTSMIMKEFYDLLGEGVPVAEALRQARLNYLQEADGEYCHPGYWSPFVLMGEGRAKIEPCPAAFPCWMALAIAVVAGGAGYGLYRLVRARRRK